MQYRLHYTGEIQIWVCVRSHVWRRFYVHSEGQGYRIDLFPLPLEAACEPPLKVPFAERDGSCQDRLLCKKEHLDRL